MHESLRLRQKLKYARFSAWSPCSSPVVIVPKPRKVDEFNTTVGTHFSHSQNIWVPSSMPILEVVLQYLSGTTNFASLNGFKDSGDSRYMWTAWKSIVYSQTWESTVPEGSYEEKLTPEMLSKQGCWKHWEISSIVACFLDWRPSGVCKRLGQVFSSTKEGIGEIR